MACQYDATHYVCNDDLAGVGYQRISNYGIGRNVVNRTGCGYKPMGSINGETYEHGTANTRITICNDINIPNWYVGVNNTISYYGKIADTPTKNYGLIGGRNNLPFRGLGALYNPSSNITHIDSKNIVCDDILQIGQILAYYIQLYGCPKRNYLTAVCRDNETGSEDIGRSYRYSYNNASIIRQIAYGNWWKDYMPDVIKYADHVTVFRPNRSFEYRSPYGAGGYLAHPLYSYFRSASILYSNTKMPNDVSESDAENENGNLVFTFTVNENDTNWHKLCELETWSTTRVYPFVRGVGDYFGGSRVTLYYKVKQSSWGCKLLIGASGEMGNRWVDECESDYGSIASLTRSCITFEMVNDCDYRNPPTSADGPFSSACFAGHGVNFKARVKRID